MAYDALASAASAAAAAATPRDIAGAAGKKKRGNRSAKLKQWKLDARREQFISQVKNKVTTMSASPTSPLPPPPITVTVPYQYYDKQDDHEGSDSESSTRSPSGTGPGSTISGAQSEEGGNGGGENENEQSEEGGNGGGENENENENEPLDDWEAVADALFAECGNGDQDPDPAPASPEKPKEPPAVQESVRVAVAPRAWKPDDAARPRSLPSLSKQRSFMVEMERQCGLPHPCCSPTMCPICCEDLDVTDSSFLPCLCGFRLCLFCYKRILEEDGRCPGCRKKYDPVAGGGVDGGSGGKVSVKYSRSLSMSTGY